MCYFAVAENLQESLTRCLNAGHTLNVDSPLRGWRGWLFRSIVDAMLIQDLKRSADPALRYFFSIVGEKERLAVEHRDDGKELEERPPLVYLSALPAARLLGK